MSVEAFPQPAAASAATIGPAPVPQGAAAAPARKRVIDNRFLMPALITVILVVGDLTYGVLESWTYTLSAIVTAVALELLLGRIVRGGWPQLWQLAGAYISGISVGILVRTNHGVWPYVVCAAITIFSKYALRWRGRHLWNPSNFAITSMLLLYPAVFTSLSIQFGNDVWVMAIIWTLGCVIIGKLKRFHICLTYVSSFFALALLRAALLDGGVGFWNTYRAEIAPITGPMYQLFIFFMITDPPTTVRAKWGRVLVAFLIAVMETAVRLLPTYAEIVGMTQEDAGLIASKAPYIALFLVGPTANLVELTFGGKNAAKP